MASEATSTFKNDFGDVDASSIPPSNSSTSSSSPVSEDTLTMLGCTCFVFFFGIIFRLILHPLHVGATFRHIVELSLGVGLILFSYGTMGLAHLTVFSGLNYATMRWAPPKWAHLLVAVEAFGYLSLLHIERMITDYGGWTFTVTTTIMMTLQKTTSLAFSLHDAHVWAADQKRDESTNDLARRGGGDATTGTANHAAKTEDAKKTEETSTSPWEGDVYRKLPSTLEYFSYIFSFHGVLIGPIAFYHDYKRFVEGTGYKDITTGKYPSLPTPLLKSPHPMGAIMKKLVQCLICGYLMVKIMPLIPMQRLVDEDFIRTHGKLKRFSFFLVAATLVRFRYYFGWILGDITNNSAGFGHAGYDQETKKPKWNLVENMNIWEIESGNSPKLLIEKWNKLSAIWLRHLVYSRHSSPWNLYLTYAVSSLWHGFYPGYYVFFATLTLVTVAARKWRRVVRPWILGIDGEVGGSGRSGDRSGINGANSGDFFDPETRESLYDTVTWLATKVIAAYFTVPFVLLSIDDICLCYSEMFWFGHVISVLLIILLPDKPMPTKTTTTTISSSTLSSPHSKLLQRLPDETGDMKKSN